MEDEKEEGCHCRSGSALPSMTVGAVLRHKRDRFRANRDGSVTLITPTGGEHTYDPDDLSDDIDF